MTKLIPVAFFVFVFTAAAFAQKPRPDSTIDGVVFGASGKPVKDVQVTACHHNPGGGCSLRYTVTDSDGRFRLDEVGKVLFFRSPGFRPSTLILSSQHPVSITLEDATNSNLQIPPCQTPAHEFNRLGSLNVSVPIKEKVKRRVGDDTREYMIFFKGDHDQRLSIWEGPGNYTGQGPLFSGFVPEDWVLNAESFSERTFLSDNKVIAVDIAGRDKAGTQWRWISTPVGVTYYHGASHDAASFCDGVLSTACVEPITNAHHR